MFRVLCLIFGYAFGLIQTGYIYGKIVHKDIRQYGSGNSGTTNALRVLGKKAGLIVFLGDLLKAIVACTIVRLIADHSGLDITLIYILYTGIGVVLGHNFPFYMNFKGGKGIAATSGVIIAIGDWRIIVVCLALFIAAVAITRYVSLGSLLVVTAFIVMWLIFGQMGMLPLTGRALYESYILVAIFVLMAYIRHKANIVRLIKGTENKLGQKKE
ncbi:MAG: glycerol-3-phosphate 1-O-acyltransferase PlsY [Lachnospiraceae bacterium]|nr:glycerol-3-phosphate 1-O-acyltransferase PlsY [Lachnospiraceae bacterium]